MFALFLLHDQCRHYSRNRTYTMAKEQKFDRLDIIDAPSDRKYGAIANTPAIGRFYAKIEAKIRLEDRVMPLESPPYIWPIS